MNSLENRYCWWMEWNVGCSFWLLHVALAVLLDRNIILMYSSRFYFGNCDRLKR